MKLRDRKKKRESGSALLVVLGFLSFMVVSAVAFAIYMRAERVPSSALRRNVATRHLVKAALAQAMSRVDDAIRNDPFPGLANTNGNVFANFYHDRDNNSMDLWLGRVFMPPDPAGLLDDGGAKVAGANEPGDLNKFSWRFAPVTETVSVLNLEALGYLPPALVNDVRFLSRSTWTAKWQNFAYDAGRFAFCAVNVSDYFDINRTRVGVRSSPLDSCISLRGTLTWHPNANQEETVSEGNFTTLGQLLGPDAARQTYSNPDGNAGSAAQTTTEYVSMLDYNLALGSQFPSGLGPVYSPFYNWVRKGSENYFYGGTIKTTQGAMQARRQPFVTDSFATNETYEVDFATLDGQPFSDIDMNGQVTVQQVAMATGAQCVRRMYDKGILGEPDVFTLYDYLDHDDIPLSLAMPSVECVPMVTAVELVGNNLAKLKVNPPAKPTVVNPQGVGPGVQTTTTEYQLDPSSFSTAGVGVRVLVAFPFRHFSGRDTTGFKVQVAMKVFVASGAVSVRPADGLSAFHPKDKAEWNGSSKSFTIDGKDPGDALAWSLYSDKVNVTIPNECKTQDDAIMQVDVTSWNGSADVPGGQIFFTTITEQPGNVSATGGFTPSGQPKYYYQFNLRPFKDGALLPAGKQEGDISSSAYASDQFRTYAMLWVRITDSSGNETYDLAPAVIADDVLNDKNNNFTIINDMAGSAPGCLLFGNDPAKFYTYANLTAGTLTGLDGSAPDWQPKSVATVDPRFNYAPEDWFAWNQSGISGGAWLDKITDAGYFNIDIEEGGTRDVFMFTSNQGFLQSLGEFAFLPRLSLWNATPGSRIPPILINAPGASATATYASDPQNILNKACAWRTYPVDRDFYADCAEVGIGRNTDGVQTVNPYSDDEAVLLAAFADTPCDYWTTGRILAGANSRNETLSADLQKIVNKMSDKNKTSGDAIGKASECLKYSFCVKNDDSSSRMKGEEIKAIMRRFAEGIRTAGAAKSWEETYDSLPWFDNLDPQDDNSFKTFFGLTLNNCPLYSIDRKFLYSYWRDCFANKQQLFLIFVRAESTALGGPGEGTPSQQGGRAVALVWREPTAYDDGSNPNSTYPDNRASQTQRQEFHIGRRPHRMRVLFYHQFD